MTRILLFALVVALLPLACKKSENVTINGNVPPNYKSVPTIKVENYVNRLFIDLLGREATDTERVFYTNMLKTTDLAHATRDTIIQILQSDSSYHDGDSSYSHAYCQRLYDQAKARFMEGAGDPDISQFIGNINFGIMIARLDGDSVAVYEGLAEKARYEKILTSKRELRLGIITYAEMCARMMNNAIYDQINMGSFNFVNAAFDDLFGREPTKEEFTKAYDVIDKNLPRDIFGFSASNKNEFLVALTTAPEFYEAQIRWCYYVLLQREASTQEVINLYSNYSKTRNMKRVQMEILRNDEYAQFVR